MTNPNNLIPASAPNGHKLTVEEASRGGKESARVRKLAKQRGEIYRELVNTPITDERLKENLRKLGVDDDNPTLETYIKANAIRNLMNNPKIKDVEILDNEVYGEREKKTSLEVSGEIEGITINVVDYSKGGK